MANTIDSTLQITEVLGFALEAYRRAMMPLTLFSTVFSNVQLKGDNTVTVPYFPLDTNDSQTRAEGGSYKALATGTATQARQITINKNKVQALSWTAEEAVRQPAFNPERLGRLKGQKLAYDILADIFSAVRAADFTGSTISATAVTNFDEEDVADLAQKCMEDNWPEMDRGLILNPGAYFNLLKQPVVIGVDQSGSDSVLREAMLRRIMGFDAFGTNGLPSNNGDAISGSAAATGDLFTAGAAHGLAVGDQITFTVLTGGAGVSTATYYYVKTVPSSTTFTISATLGGSTLDVTTNYSAFTCSKKENIIGIACHSSALLIATAPVAPSAAMRSQLADYQIVTDPSTQIALEYKHLVYPDTNEEVQVIEARYGYAYGETAAIKRIVAALS